MLTIRHALRTFVDFVLYAVRSGHIWLPVLVVVLAVATVLIAAIKTVAPAVYVLF